jgi:hypothetical protein
MKLSLDYSEENSINLDGPQKECVENSRNSDGPRKSKEENSINLDGPKETAWKTQIIRMANKKQRGRLM